jgi:hypothetical protein
VTESGPIKGLPRSDGDPYHGSQPRLDESLESHLEKESVPASLLTADQDREARQCASQCFGG